jgi:hypothetical protein
MSTRQFTLGLLLVQLLLSGCAGAPRGLTGTGAKEVVQSYFEALLQQDWKRAYIALNTESQARCTADQFTRLAQAYRRDLSFEPDALKVRSCEEHGEEAIAHVVFSGQSGSHLRLFKDGAALRREAGSWRVVLSSHFGRSRGR